jgi:hypothetical protein
MLPYQSSPQLKRQQGILRADIFSLFSPSQKTGRKSKKKYHSLVKELLLYHLLCKCAFCFYWTHRQG